MFKPNKIFISLFTIIVVSFYLIGAFFNNLSNQSEISILLTIILCLPVLYYLSYNNNSVFKFFVIVGILIRVIFIFAPPALSSDSYRIIWDGILLSKGINPNLDIPVELISIEKILSLKSMHELLWKLNSLADKSIYGPIPIYISAINSFIFGTNSTILLFLIRLEFLLLDLMTFFFLIKSLDLIEAKNEFVLLWFLNPLSIATSYLFVSASSFISLGMVLVVYYLLKSKYFKVALFFSITLLSDIRLIFLYPFIFKRKQGHVKEFTILLFSIMFLLYLPFGLNNSIIESIQKNINGNFLYLFFAYAILTVVGLKIKSINIYSFIFLLLLFLIIFYPSNLFLLLSYSMVFCVIQIALIEKNFNAIANKPKS